MHLLQQRGLVIELPSIALGNRGLVDLLAEEPAGLAEVLHLLLIELHETSIGLGVAVAGHLTEAEGGRCIGIRRAGRLLVKPEAVLSEDVLAIVLLETGKLVTRLDRASVVGRLCSLLLLSLLKLLGELQEADLASVDIAKRSQGSRRVDGWQRAYTRGRRVSLLECWLVEAVGRERESEVWPSARLRQWLLRLECLRVEPHAGRLRWDDGSSEARSECDRLLILVEYLPIR